MIRRIAPFLLAAAAPALAASPPPPVIEAVEPAADGSFSLSHEVVVPARPDEVWAAIATADGWKSWAVPVAWIAAARPDVIETSYNPAAAPGDPMNIENEFLVRVPGRRLVFQTVKAPAGFAHFDSLRKVTQSFDLTPEGSGTRVRLTGTNYGADPSGQAVLAFFRSGNRVSLEMLRDRFARGPIDWTEKLNKPLK